MNEEINLIVARKKELLEKFKSVVLTEQEIGKAIQLKKECLFEWNAIEHTPSSATRQINQEFQKLVEDFNYNLNIYKAIKDHDLKRNQQIKEEILVQLNKLNNTNNNIGNTLKLLQKQWFETGPVKRELRDDFWQKFKDASQKILDKLGELKEQEKAQEQKNLTDKEAIISYLQTLLSDTPTKEKQWRIKTDLIVEKQKEWKQIGHVPKNQSNIIWNKYKDLCDTFFKEKSVFYESLKEIHKNNKKEKLALCDKAEEIINNSNTSHEDKTKAINTLQRNWKNIGQAHPRDEQKLWVKFQDICNLFFNNLRKAKEQEQENANQSLSAKKDLAEELITTHEREALITLLKKWYLLDDNIKKTPNDLHTRFFELFNEKLLATGTSKTESDELKYSLKIQCYREINNLDLLHKEYNFIKDHLNKVEEEKNKFENNLGFFKHAKSDNPMIVELREKVEKMNTEIQSQKNKLNHLYKLLK